MPVLKNAREEKFAQARAAGKTIDASYQIAGYKANRSNAARLNSKEHIQKRIAELQTKQVAKVHEYAAINVREQMHKLLEIRDAATEAGDIKTAADIQKFVMKMFGFEDMPTLTHEMLGERGLQQQAPVQPDQGTPQPRNILQFGRVHQKLQELAGPRVIEHDPKK